MAEANEQAVPVEEAFDHADKRKLWCGAVSELGRLQTTLLRVARYPATALAAPSSSLIG